MSTDPQPHTMSRSPMPAGVGIGLRSPHYDAVETTRPDVAFLEVHPENFFGAGRHVDYLIAMSEIYPISLHGVGLSLGSTDDLCPRHLASLKHLVDVVKPALVSDHASWSLSGNAHLNDLLPLPYTDETLRVVADHVNQVQDVLGRQMLVENPSTYLAYEHSEMSEPAFLAGLVERTGCRLLLDMNNIYVQQHNIGVDPKEYFARLDRDAVGEMHLAGYSEEVIDGTPLLIDTHSRRVQDDVWGLYADAIRHFGAVPTLIEWDKDIPELAVLLEEASKADALMREISGQGGAYATG